MDSLDRVVPIAEVVPLFPPRPDAIVTMLTSDDFLAGAQTLLYSIQVNDGIHVLQENSVEVLNETH